MYLNRQTVKFLDVTSILDDLTSTLLLLVYKWVYFSVKTNYILQTFAISVKDLVDEMCLFDASILVVLLCRHKRVGLSIITHLFNERTCLYWLTNEFHVMLFSTTRWRPILTLTCLSSGSFCSLLSAYAKKAWMPSSLYSNLSTGLLWSISMQRRGALSALKLVVSTETLPKISGFVLSEWSDSKMGE